MWCLFKPPILFIIPSTTSPAYLRKNCLHNCVMFQHNLCSLLVCKIGLSALPTGLIEWKCIVHVRKGDKWLVNFHMKMDLWKFMLEGAQMSAFPADYNMNVGSMCVWIQYCTLAIGNSSECRFYNLIIVFIDKMLE